MVGGEKEVFEQARPVLATFGSTVVHVGALGSGEMLKLVNNYVFTAYLGLLKDTVDLLSKLGLDIAQSALAIAASTGSSRAMQFFVDGDSDNTFPRHTEGRAHGAALLAKDIGLIDSLTADSGIAFPELLDAAVRSGLQMALDSGAADLAAGKC